ncbi:MAG TPA: class I SAM-dependent RNA methyltransferase [Anaerolineae bacterium]|nr:class I SAM-dependent RNA methyltransferase [Anaerolineae bacterium]
MGDAGKWWGVGYNVQEGSLSARALWRGVDYQPTMPDDILELKLTGIAHGGEALGKVDARVIFVAFALPGERVRVQLVEVHKRWARARLLEVLEPSPYRIDPACPYFGPGRCGGCQWQHIAREAQTDYKARILRDQLQRLGGLKKPRILPTRAADEPWRYRTQMVFYPAGEVLGLRRVGSYEALSIEACPILHPDLEALFRDFNVAWDGLRSVDLAVSRSTGEKLVALRTRRDEAPAIEVDFPVSIVLERSDGRVQPLVGQPWYFETIAGHTYRFSAGARRPFNIPATALLIETVRELLAAGPGHAVMDVYAGQGLFTLGLAEQVSLIIGVEENPYAIEDAAFSCGHLDNVVLHEGPPPKVLRKLKDPIDLAIVSPPEEGLGHRIPQNLARLGAHRVAYVASNPATLARDIEKMQAAHYRFVEAVAVDIAPQTYYFTTVALFSR